MSSPPSTCPSVRGPVERPIGAFADPGPQALVPLCGQLRIQGLCFEHSGHPGETRGISDARFGGGPVLSRHAPGSRMTRRQLRGPPHQATTPGRPDSAILTRAPSCVRCARRAVSAVAADRSGSAFVLENGSVLLLGPNSLHSPRLP